MPLPARPPSAPSPRSRIAPATDASTLPLSSRTASTLAYSAGWLSGVMVLSLEGRRAEVRHHAAQSLVGFGLLTVLSLLLLSLSALSLFASITMFRALLWAAQGVILAGIVCWLASLVQAARGRDFRWPLIGGWVDRLASLDD